MIFSLRIVLNIIMLSGMMSNDSDFVRSPASFAATHWSAVVLAGSRDAPGSQAAWEELYRSYWYPLYAFVRRSGKLPEEAADLTQDFFVDLMSKGSLARADPQMGRFRSFLLGALKHKLSDHAREQRAEKRGGLFQSVSLDVILREEGEARFLHQAGENGIPEAIFDREWADAMVNRVLERLQREWQRRPEDQAKFDQLRPFLLRGKEGGHLLETGKSLRLSESAIRSLLHRLRTRFAGLLREEVALTVPDAADVEDELRHLLVALSA
jgi:RNA polymerase sigma-70 factor (ECF subfamily)